MKLLRINMYVNTCKTNKELVGTTLLSNIMNELEDKFGVSEVGFEVNIAPSNVLDIRFIVSIDFHAEILSKINEVLSSHLEDAEDSFYDWDTIEVSSKVGN